MTDLTHFLQQAGYQQINLDLNGVGHFQTMVKLRNNRLRVLINTGAAVTLLHLEVAQRMGLSLNKLEHKGGADGVGLDVFSIQEHFPKPSSKTSVKPTPQSMPR